MGAAIKGEVVADAVEAQLGPILDRIDAVEGSDQLPPALDDELTGRDAFGRRRRDVAPASKAAPVRRDAMGRSRR